MGLGFTIYFPIDDTKNIGKDYYENYFAALPSIIPNWSARFFTDSNGFRLQLVPFEEDVYGSYENGTLCISAKTNSAGPGYHAYLIDVLDELDVVPTKVYDETKYYEHRDFDLLQKNMMNWLRGLSNQLLEMTASGEYNNLAVCLPIDCVPESSEHLANCPLGYFDIDFFEKAVNNVPVGPKFFLWWHKPQDALFFHNTALHLIWCKNNWLPPETDAEHEIIAATLACLEKAYTLNPSLNYPMPEWKELTTLAGCNSEFESVYAEKIATYQTQHGIDMQASLGYTHGNVCQNENGWRFTRSGKMHFDREDDGGAVWWDDERTIRLTILSVAFKEDVQNKSESLLHSATKNESGCEPFSLRNSEIAACIQHTQIEENGEPLFQTRLTAALDNELCILSLFHTNEADRDWALHVCASVER